MSDYGVKINPGAPIPGIILFLVAGDDTPRAERVWNKMQSMPFPQSAQETYAQILALKEVS